MRLFLGLCALLILGGCAGPSDTSTFSESAGPTVAAAPDVKFGRRSELGLINGRRLLRVGDSSRDAVSFFPKPDNAVDIRDIPPAWETKFRGRGWQTPSENFGVLMPLNEDTVALAVRIYEHVNEKDKEFFDEIVQRYQAHFPNLKPLTETAQISRYLFAQSGNDRLMICATRTSAGELTITLAVGMIAVMDALRMSPDAARQDAERAENRFKVIG